MGVDVCEYSSYSEQWQVCVRGSLRAEYSNTQVWNESGREDCTVCGSKVVGL